MSLDPFWPRQLRKVVETVEKDPDHVWHHLLQNSSVSARCDPLLGAHSKRTATGSDALIRWSQAMRLLDLLDLSLSALFGASAADRRRLQDWRKAVENCGLTVVENRRWSWSPRLTAESGPVTVRLVEEEEDVLVVAKLRGPPDLATVMIDREQVNLPLREIEVGDEIFDNTLNVKGWTPFVRALLDERVRYLLLEANREGPLSLAGGELRLKVPSRRFARVVPLLIDLARQLTRRRDIPQCLAENVRTDSEPGVRHRSLFLLIEAYPGYPNTLEALRLAGVDPDPQIRLRVGRELGAEGHGVLLSLAETVEDDALIAQAVVALGSALPFKRGRAILRRALRRRRTATARACLEELGTRGGIAVPVLAEAVAHEDTELAVLAARSLGTIGDAAAEPALVEALARDDSDLRNAAAAALGRLGSVESVLPLQKAAERSVPGTRLRRTAHQAIAEIQSRLLGATHGQLSLAAADAGQLSLASAEAGELSLAADPDGQLSFPAEQDSRKKKRTRSQERGTS